MSWSDTLKGAIGGALDQAQAAGLGGMINSVLGAEGTQAILQKLRDAGLDAQVQSWLDKAKSNLPISEEQLKTALGDEHVQQLAKSLGIPVDQVLAALAAHLPQAVSTTAGASAPDQKTSP